MRDDDVLDSGIELGEELLPQALNGGLYIARSEWLPRGRFNPGLSTYCAETGPVAIPAAAIPAADQNVLRSIQASIIKPGGWDTPFG
jgi:hypothetical protein